MLGNGYVNSSKVFILPDQAGDANYSGSLQRDLDSRLPGFKALLTLCRICLLSKRHCSWFLGICAKDPCTILSDSTMLHRMCVVFAEY